MTIPSKNKSPGFTHHCVISRNAVPRLHLPSCSSRPNRPPRPAACPPRHPSSWQEGCRILLPLPWVIPPFHFPVYSCRIGKSESDQEESCRTPYLPPVATTGGYESHDPHYVTENCNRFTHHLMYLSLSFIFPKSSIRATDARIFTLPSVLSGAFSMSPRFT